VVRYKGLSLKKQVKIIGKDIILRIEAQANWGYQRMRNHDDWINLRIQRGQITHKIIELGQIMNDATSYQINSWTLEPIMKYIQAETPRKLTPSNLQSNNKESIHMSMNDTTHRFHKDCWMMFHIQEDWGLKIQIDRITILHYWIQMAIFITDQDIPIQKKWRIEMWWSNKSLK